MFNRFIKWLKKVFSSSISKSSNDLLDIAEISDNETKTSEIQKKEDDMRKCDLNVLFTQKLGISPDEYEDAFYVPFSTCPKDNDLFNVSISDGATESSFSKEWSEILVNGIFAQDFENDNLIETLKELRKKWKEEIAKKDLPWFAQEKMQKGAFSAFLSVLFDLKNNIWKSFCIGDCELFLVRNNNLLASFPFENSMDFNNNPYLLSSNVQQTIEIDKLFQKKQGDIQKGDMFLLLTDAIATWFLKEYENGKLPWETIIERFEEDDYETWINEQRKSKVLKNDDSTIILIEF